jgi:hypothetical protein
LLDVYLLRPENSLFSCNIVQGISNHCAVLLEVEWGEIFRAPQLETLVSVYHKTDFLGLQTFLRDKFARWAGNGSFVEEIWEHFKEIVFESIERSLLHKIPKKKNPDPEYYNREVKRLKARVRRA